MQQGGKGAEELHGSCYSEPRPLGDAWIDQLAAAYEVIPMDASMFREWARLIAGKSDHLLEDAMIAATARVRGLVVVTRNVRDFQMFRVEVLNPSRVRR